MKRADILDTLNHPKPFDLVVVGGGATGLGVALEAARAGLTVVLVEAADFASGTSSRSTKLVHGGVRYLAQGRIGLVREALRERAYMLRAAPHLAQPRAFIVPAYRWWERAFYGAGLFLYDLLAGQARLAPTRWLTRNEVLGALPGVRADGLRGGVQYWDGQFDDARYAVALARTAHQSGALLINHAPARQLLMQQGRVAGLVVEDAETGEHIEVRARCVINATGVWADALRRQEAEDLGAATEPLLTPSQGVHLVVDADFLAGDTALLVPATADGRVLFAVPWHGKVILGTTDTPRPDVPREPEPYAEEVAFILREAGRYLSRAPSVADIRSCWVGLRPLVRPAQSPMGGTAGISREHTIRIGAAGLVTVTGGKWTTHRAMARDVLRQSVRAGLLPAGTSLPKGDAPPLIGAGPAPADAIPGYGCESVVVRALPGAERPLGWGLTEAMVRYAARYEYARTVEDMLARRHRLLFLDAAAAASVAPAVARILAEETGADPGLDAFLALAARYHYGPTS